MEVIKELSKQRNSEYSHTKTPPALTSEVLTPSSDLRSLDCFMMLSYLFRYYNLMLTIAPVYQFPIS